MDSQSQSVTRYRVTLDFTVDNRGNPPSNWNWNKLLELDDSDGERELSRYMLRIWEKLPLVSIKLRRQSDGQSKAN